MFKPFSKLFLSHGKPYLIKPNQFLLLNQYYRFSTQEKQNQHESKENEEKKEEDDDNTFINPETGEELGIDNRFDNLLHGIFNRDDYEKATGRSAYEVGRLGRLFIYQHHCCPFSGKVKAVLDYYKIPYSLIEVGPVTKTQLPNRKKFLHDRTVPILLAAKTGKQIR